MAKPNLKVYCGLCKNPIDLTKDNYCHLEDFREGKFVMEGWYHIICWQDRFGKNKQMMEKAHAILNKAAEMIGYKEEKKYEIPA